jgi:hypothetical protein
MPPKAYCHQASSCTYLHCTIKYLRLLHVTAAALCKALHICCQGQCYQGFAVIFLHCTNKQICSFHCACCCAPYGHTLHLLSGVCASRALPAPFSTAQSNNSGQCILPAAAPCMGICFICVRCMCCQGHVLPGLCLHLPAQAAHISRQCSHGARHQQRHLWQGEAARQLGQPQGSWLI